MTRCPACASTFVRPAVPNWWQFRLLGLTAKRPHECWHCGWRGWRVPEPFDETPERHSQTLPGGESRDPARSGSRSTHVA